jgi:5'-nucleotidase
MCTVILILLPTIREIQIWAVWRESFTNWNDQEEDPNVLLDAGDIFQGLYYYGGELEFKLMSMMQYDASTIGNHDFDNGVEGLYAQMPHANLNSYRPIMILKIRSWKAKPYKIFNKTASGLVSLELEL